MSSTVITIKDYSTLSFVVFGDTKIHKDKLKELGGKYNGKLSVGPGWIFSLDKREKIQEWYDGLSSKVVDDYGKKSVEDEIIKLKKEIIELREKNANLEKEKDELIEENQELQEMLIK